jgi:hypothetical protein
MLIVFAVYVAVWTVTYALFMEGDFRYYPSYVMAVFSGSGEGPALITIYSLMAGAVILIVAVVFAAARRLFGK